MDEKKTVNLYFVLCIVQSLIIIGLAWYIGVKEKECDTAFQENERNRFALQIRESELQKLKGILDTCNDKE